MNSFSLFSYNLYEHFLGQTISAVKITLLLSAFSWNVSLNLHYDNFIWLTRQLIVSQLITETFCMAQLNLSLFQNIDEIFSRENLFANFIRRRPDILYADLMVGSKSPALCQILWHLTQHKATIIELKTSHVLLKRWGANFCMKPILVMRWANRRI